MTPYVGDIRLHDFASYVQNHVRWEIGHSAAEQNENNVTMWVRGESTPLYDIWRQQVALLSSFKVVSAITDFQEEAITSCLDTIRRNQTSVVLACKLRWKVSSKVLKRKDPFNPPNFIEALSQVSQYIQCIRACGIHRLGLKFQYLLIWLLVDKYQISYKLSPYQESQWCHHLINTCGYRVDGQDVAYSYNLSNLHEVSALPSSDSD